MLVPDDVQAHDGFGARVDLQGDRALIASPYDDHAGFNSVGSVYVFDRIDGNWQQSAKLVPLDPASANAFGSAIAIDGDKAVVGDPYDGENLPVQHRGAVYVFTRTDQGWVQSAKLIASDWAFHDQLGSAVAVAGDTILAGAPGDDHQASLEAGSVYIFEQNAGQWTQVQKLLPNDSSSNQLFGFSISRNGATAIISSLEDNHGLSAGAVYVFQQSGVTWEQAAKLIASDPANGDGFGQSLAFDGATIVMGTFKDTLAGDAAGAAYVFQQRGGAWMEIGVLEASDATASSYFSSDVAVHGDTVLVGATRYPPQFEVVEGQAYVYSLGSLCGSVPGDITGDGTVNVNDLLAVINAWGPCPPPPTPCPADVNADGVVNVDDLLLVINSWG